jgi:hypothetical protein
MVHSLHHPRWVNHDRSAGGVQVFDLTADSPIAT